MSQIANKTRPSKSRKNVALYVHRSVPTLDPSPTAREVNSNGDPPPPRRTVRRTTPDQENNARDQSAIIAQCVHVRRRAVTSEPARLSGRRPPAPAFSDRRRLPYLA
ncbi:hypothetical protein EVAR_78668_1 [Eumeta japonica]|uniref:Uncharacterized protein n=1 Tax=Eumeta variegata TaxID=151549 RepID=A0A4C1U820_EUMVA|nr:hypothetical protein EVAR_78668_1 [Eumeta japonica]